MTVPVNPNRNPRPSLARSFFALLAGLIVAVTVVSICDLAAGTLHPVPEGFDLLDAEQVGAHLSSAPASAMLVVLLGWLLGPFAGGVVASRVAARRRRQCPWVIASVFMAFIIVNLGSIPHPAWMVVAALLGVPASGWFAGRLAPPDEV